MVNVFNSINNSSNAQSRVYNNISSIHTALRSLIDDMLTDNTHASAAAAAAAAAGTNIISNCNKVSSVDDCDTPLSSDGASACAMRHERDAVTTVASRRTAKTRTTCTFDSRIDYNNITHFTCNTRGGGGGEEDCCNNKLSTSHAQDNCASFYMNQSKSLKKQRGANISPSKRKATKQTTASSCSLDNEIRHTYKPRVNYTCFNVSWAVTVLLMTCFTRETMQAKVDTSITLSSSAASTLPKSSSLSTFNSEFDACYNFTIGDRTKGEFYSPGYPNNYPNNTECIALITGEWYCFVFRVSLHWPIE